MHYVAIFFAFIAAVASNDLDVGTNYGRIVFDEKIEASPYFSIRRENVTVNVTEHEVISRVVVTDDRPGKDGAAKIVEGGVGHANVTIELQSPAIFRGLYFHVTVYAVESDGQHLLATDDATRAKGDIDTSKTSSQAPSDVLIDNQSGIDKDSQRAANPVDKDQGRINRDTQQAVDDKYVNDDKATTEARTVQNVSADISGVSIKGQMHPQILTKDIPHLSDKSSTEVPSATEVPSTKSTINESTSSPVQITHQNYDAISKELNQKVIIGIKH